MIINSTDVFEFSHIPDPKSVSTGKPADACPQFTSRYHPKAGSIRFRNALFPHMHLMNLCWQTEEAIELHDSSPSDTVNINFHLSGKLDTQFVGIKRELNMRPRKHNLVYAPDGGNINKVASKSSLEMFHISLEKNFFSGALGCDDPWSEKIHENLYHNRPFSGTEGTLDMTPHMLRLIDEMRVCTYSGPMRNLMIQSKTLELLALQIEQFKSPGPASDSVKPDEAEKLYALKKHLEVHFLSDLSLSELSRVCLLNEFKVKKGFKTLFGETVFGYVRKLRMEYAAKLLKDCNMSVEAVANILGYEHSQHFSVAFKKFTGVSPSQIGSYAFKPNLIRQAS
ncbi:helix-turn-helix transcriptional regulator [Dyadobacter sp. CY323]|uniref:helix-turn-helix transcriptional regulator n=1 Tax=Dyadobacter sp. CY323 TaxID=2907302 RepID=UPI001F48D8E5|nr:helix-turn-helix transcriptional regulator [Dyadobacter sp. CY323]MCE6990023.1 helix-turn-helix transcriptional regulator [Dyadobacter sp. CY323]